MKKITYTQTTILPDGTERSRVISETKLVHLMSQIMILKQAGENIEWHSISSPDYLWLERYEMSRMTPKGEYYTVFTPNEPQRAWIDE